MTEKLLLTPSEAGQRLSIGRTKVYSLIASGEIPSVRVGHSLRVPVLALEKWIQQRMQTTNDAA